MEFNYILSDQSINSKKYIILTSGIQLDEFNANPVALHNHDIDQVVGRWNNVRINEADPEQLIGTLTFNMDDEDSAKIASKVSKNLIKHISVGLELVAGYVDIIRDEEVIVITNCILKEGSVTPLPANTNAIKLTYEGEHIKDFTQFTNNLNLNTNTMSKEIKGIEGGKVLELTTKVGELEASAVLLQTDKTDLAKDLELKDAEVLELTSKVTELEAKLQGIADADAQVKFTALLDEAITEGKIKSDQKDVFLTLSFESAKTIIDGLESKVISPELNLSAEIKSTPKVEKVSTDEVKDMKWYEQNDLPALKLMYQEDRPSYDKLYNARIK